MSVVAVRIPQAHRNALQTLRDLSHVDFESMRAELAAAPEYVPLSELPKYAMRAEALDEEDASAVVLALLSLYSQLKFHGWTEEDLAEAVTKSRDLPPPDDGGDARDFATRIERLLKLDSISTTGRALDLLTEHEHVFHSARVLTDIRPLFGEDPSQPPSGAVLTEMLKVEYYDEGTSKSLYITLDQGDLEDLSRTVERALAKTATLRAFLESVGLSHFELKEE